MTDAIPQIDDARAKRNVAVLVAAQAFLGAQMPMIFTIGGLAGSMLAPNPCLGTLPISMTVFGSMTTAPWLSPLMQRRGRRFGFVVGTMAAMVGALLSAIGLYTGQFLILLIGAYFTGIYQSAQGFFRFAATDTASDAFKPKAISYVLGGGLVAALLGRELNNRFIDILPISFLGSYLVIIAINLIGVFLFLALDIPKGSGSGVAQAELPPARSKRQLLQSPDILVSIIVAMVSYALMNLVMTSTPLAVVGCGYAKTDATNIVTAHVLAMFIPSFFTGHLIARFGTKPIMAMGLLILACAGVAAILGVQFTETAMPSLISFYVALVLLGVGWNFGFIGATSLLTKSHAPHERGVVQGMNDMIVFGCVTVASLASGGLMNCGGSSPIEGWTAVNLMMVPFLALAGGALIWLTLRPKSI